MVRGRPLKQGIFPAMKPSDPPHLHILLDDGARKHDVAVNVFSQDDSEVLFRIVPNFALQRAAELLALPSGDTRIGSGNQNGLGLDYLRQHLVSRDEMSLLPIDPHNLESDLNNGLGDLVASAIDSGADLFAFGSLFDDSHGGQGGPNPFGINPEIGVHDIHMNQGNPPHNHDQDNGTFQDGGLLVHFSEPNERWVAVFLAFQSQSFVASDAGEPGLLPAATRIVPGRFRPAALGWPAEFHASVEFDRMAHILENLQPIPPPRVDPPVFGLGAVIGDPAVQAIEHAGRIVVHAVGDTGHGDHTSQTDVADAMASDYQRPNPDDRPAFFFHLGDVIYGHHKDTLYREQFYNPYDHYPGQIVAIPGNHDGEVFPNDDPQTLHAFLANFCDSERRHPAIAGTLPRLTEAQPGVYFMLEAPFVRFIGLYSNVAENPGFISSDTIGDAQKQFLVNQLREVGRRRAQGDTAALVLAVHHPPFSGGGHSGSREMLADIDEAVRQAGVGPDVVLAAHAHNYQRFTRKVFVDGAPMQVPYIVAGGGGRGITPIKLAADSLPVEGALPGNDQSQVALRQYYNGFGYLTLTVTRRIVTVDFFAVPAGADVPLDSVTLDLKTHQITHERPSFSHPLSGESVGGNRVRLME